MSVCMPVRNTVFLSSLAFAAIMAAALAAPSAIAAADVYEGPSRFARVRALEGKILIGHAYDSDFVELQRNEPVGEGDRLSLEKGARILLAFNDGTQLAAAGPTRVELLRLAPSRPFEVRLHEGEIVVDTPDHRQLMVDSPEGTVTIEDDSRGNLELDDDGLRVSVQRGTALAGDEEAERLSAGDRVDMNGGEPGDSSRAGIGDGQVLYGWMNSAGRNDEPAAAPVPPARNPKGAAPPNHSADSDFADEYDSGDDDAHNLRDSRRELPAEVDHYYDELNAYGRWRFVPGYGWAWRPHRVARGWVPFTAGFWRHTPWGMFWVSYEPWGWAPYRYGSWRFEPRWGWFWVPGPRFGGAWVVFYGEGDTWGWSPAYYDSGEWYPSYTTYIQINVINIYNYHPPIQIINRPPVRRPILGRPPLPAPPVGGGFSRGLPRLPRVEPGSAPDGIRRPPVRPATEVWRPRPVLGRPASGPTVNPPGPRGIPGQPNQNGNRPIRPAGPDGIRKPSPDPDNPPIPRTPRERPAPTRPVPPSSRPAGVPDNPPAREPRRAPAATPRETPAPAPPASAPSRPAPRPKRDKDSAADHSSPA